MSGLVEINNLDAKQVWHTAGPAYFAHPTFRWTASDPDGEAITNHSVAIYSAATGGTLLYDSGVLGGDPGVHAASFSVNNLTAYWVAVNVRDTTGEWSASARIQFKVAWGQAIYEYAVPGGATTSGWSFSSAPMPANTKSAFLFRSGSTAGFTTGLWDNDISNVTPNAYLQVLVRLSTNVAGTDATLTDMTFSYLGSASQPDYYIFNPDVDWALDPGAYRYGTQSLKFSVTDNSTDRLIYPFRATAGDDILVLPSRPYVFSGFAKTNGPLHSGSDIRLQIYAAGGLTSLLAEGSLIPPNVGDPGRGATNDTTLAEAGWERLQLHYEVPAGVTALRPVVRYHNGGAGNGDSGWLDALQFEAGVVVSPWHAVALSQAAILDGYGLVLDAQAGATVRARASDGVTANLDEIVHAAAGGGGGGGGADFVTVGTGTLITDLVTVG